MLSALPQSANGSLLRAAAPTRRRPGDATIALAATAAASSSSSPSQPQPPQHAKVRFSLNFRCEFGQELAVVGSHCGWEPAAATSLNWTEGDWWSGEVELPLALDAEASSSSPPSSSASSASSLSAPAPPVEIEYKYIVRQGQHAAAWQPDSNFALRLGPIERSDEGSGDGGGGGSSGSSSSSLQQQRRQQKRSLENCFLLLPSRVEVGDSWDGAVHQVTPIEVVEIPLSLPGQLPPPPLSAAEAAEGLRSALSAAVSALDDKRVSPASKEALEADARVAEAAARASAAAAAVSAAAVSKIKKRGLLRE